MIYDILASTLIAMWIILPAYITNPAAALFGGGKTVDRGLVLSDGRRLLGDGKTYSGLLSGILTGLLTGIIQTYLVMSGWELFGIKFPLFELVPTENGIGFKAIVTILSLSAGALLGDIAMSFIKRRIGMESGDSFPIADQYDFIVGAFLLVSLTSWDWVVNTITIKTIIIILIMTPILHIVANIIAYLTKVKKVPW